MCVGVLLLILAAKQGLKSSTNYKTMPFSSSLSLPRMFTTLGSLRHCRKKPHHPDPDHHHHDDHDFPDCPDSTSTGFEGFFFFLGGPFNELGVGKRLKFFHIFVSCDVLHMQLLDSAEIWLQYIT